MTEIFAGTSAISRDGVTRLVDTEKKIPLFERRVFLIRGARSRFARLGGSIPE